MGDQRRTTRPLGGHQGPVERDLRRSPTLDGGDVVQLRRGRFLGVGRRSGLSGEVFGARHPHRRELRDVFADALTRWADLDSYFPTRCCVSLLFSLHTYSSISVSGIRLIPYATVHGFV